MLSLCAKNIEAFKGYLWEQEYSKATIEKYIRDVRLLGCFCGKKIEQKKKLISFKEHLVQSGYAATSINSMLASINRFLTFAKQESWKMRYLKIQKKLFLSSDRELTQKEYMKMVKKAAENGEQKLCLILQTICSTGIRISELCAVTVESLQKRCAQVYLKGKLRQIIIPHKLCTALKHYCEEQGISSGAVFTTRSGKALDRSNLWKMMKRLASNAGVKRKKAFPHNLRHLFARTYYQKYQDVVWLSDILGHSSINTTRVYTMKNLCEQEKQVNQLSLLINLHTT